jgi:hypothetical protein
MHATLTTPQPIAAPSHLPLRARATPALSLRGAIDAHCRSCIVDPAAAGNWRQQVTVCTCTRCALWPVRPISSSAPDFLAARDPAAVPAAFLTLSQEQAIAALASSS